MSDINDLVRLLNGLLTRMDELPDHSVRDAKGNAIRRPKDKQTTWYMKLIHEHFPGIKDDIIGDCQAIGSCMKYLFGKYVRALAHLKLTTTHQRPSASSQSTYYSDVKAAMII